MGQINSFRDLLAWKAAMDLAEAVYRWTAGFPSSERFGLVPQMQRAGTSVPCNIAEGWGSGTTRLFLRRLRDARGSLAELDTQIELAVRVHAVQPSEQMKTHRENAGRLLQGLFSSLERKLRKENPPQDRE